ncbi:unnamed protein product [Mycena citricolor]|uniref:Uncharacterized protein n=1 Tax=Mycena citricolor TaxID=2018698 RepID=A0AAD2GWA3_9AGAR|nr:unnamed protein product [Mycena citricolor]
MGTGDSLRVATGSTGDGTGCIGVVTRKGSCPTPSGTGLVGSICLNPEEEAFLDGAVIFTGVTGRDDSFGLGAGPF